MKMNRVTAYLTAAAICVSLVCSAFGTEKKEETVLWPDVPSAVRQAVKELVPRRTIQKIEKDDENGKTSYEFQVDRNGKKSEITLTTDGKLLSLEEVVALADAPAAVRQSLETQAAGGKMGTVEKVTEDGKTTFETKVEKGGKKLEITVTPEGNVAGTEDVTKEKE